MKSQNTNNNKGFTLIELLMVIAIIGILSSVILVSMSASRNKAKAAATISVIRSLQPAVASCCTRQQNAFRIVEGVDICTIPVGAILPTSQELNAEGVTYGIAALCSATDPIFTVTLSGHPISGCNARFNVGISSTTIPSGCK